MRDVVLDDVERLDDQPPGLLEVLGSDEVQIVGRGVVFGESTDCCVAAAPTGQIEPGRTVLALVIAVGLKSQIDCGIVRAHAAGLLGAHASWPGRSTASPRRLFL